jgi:hypothetical protein
VSTALTLRDVEAELATALLDTSALAKPVEPQAPKKHDLEEWGFSPADIAAWETWEDGGPVPETPGGLELMAITIKLEEEV